MAVGGIARGEGAADGGSRPAHGRRIHGRVPFGTVVGTTHRPQRPGEDYKKTPEGQELEARLGAPEGAKFAFGNALEGARKPQGGPRGPRAGGCD